MFMISNFLLAIAKLLNFALSAYIWVVIGRAVISWVNADPYNPIVRFLIQVTDPVLLRIRRFVPSMGGIDLSPMILILAIVQLPPILLLGPIAVYVFSVHATTPAVIFLIWSILVSVSDSFLKISVQFVKYLLKEVVQKYMIYF